MRCKSDRGPEREKEEGTRRAISEAPRFVGSAEGAELVCPRPMQRVRTDTLEEAGSRDSVVESEKTEVAPLGLEKMNESSSPHTTAADSALPSTVEEDSETMHEIPTMQPLASEPVAAELPLRSALENTTNQNPKIKEARRLSKAGSVRVLVQMIDVISDENVRPQSTQLDHLPQDIPAPPPSPAVSLVAVSDAPRSPRYSMVPYGRVTSRKPQRNSMYDGPASLRGSPKPSDGYASPIAKAHQEYKRRVVEQDKRVSLKDRAEANIAQPVFPAIQRAAPGNTAGDDVFSMPQAPAPVIGSSFEPRPTLRRMARYERPVPLKLVTGDELKKVQPAEPSPTPSEIVAHVKEKRKNAFVAGRTPLGERKLNIPAEPLSGDNTPPKESGSRMGWLKRMGTSTSTHSVSTVNLVVPTEKCTLTPNVCNTEGFSSPSSVLTDISILGSRRKQIKRALSNLSMKSAGTDFPFRQKENVPPSGRSKLDALAGFFRLPSPLRRACSGTPTKQPKTGPSTRSPAEEVGCLSQEQVDKLIQSLAPTATPLPGIPVGGRYFTAVHPSLDKSPTREQKRKNPIAVCMDFLEEADRLPDGEQKEELLRMSHAIVQYIDRASFAHQSVEAAQINSDLELSEVRKAQQVVEDIKKQLEAAENTVNRKMLEWIKARQLENSAKKQAERETANVVAVVDLFVVRKEEVDVDAELDAVHSTPVPYSTAFSSTTTTIA